MQYNIKKTNVIDPCINSPEWDKAYLGNVSCQRWKEYFQPIHTTFKLLRGPKGFSVLMHTDEKNLRAEHTEQNSMVCEDSCMEFFFNPDPSDVKYINFEVNPKNVLHLSIGDDVNERQLIAVDRKIFNMEAIPNDGDWTLKFYIPDSFLLKYFDRISDICVGNFYKCGDFTDHPHYASWKEVETEEPNFHTPRYFGILENKG